VVRALACTHPQLMVSQRCQRCQRQTRCAC
jgi:hypothetical protein